MLKTPPLQTATATIDTLCGRLQSATLLEDRRAAILGLRSFAKQYPASVASGSLRELITTLRRDGLGEATGSKDKDADTNGVDEGGDVDTIRLVMETLLMLFNPDKNSPEAGDEIAFFLADEFSMVCTPSKHRYRGTVRAKLIPAPRQHIPTVEPPRSYLALCRLLLETIQRADPDCRLRRATGSIARVCSQCAFGNQPCRWSSGRCKRRCEKRRSTAAGRFDGRCERRLAQDCRFRGCLWQGLRSHPHGRWACRCRHCWSGLSQPACKPHTRLR
jgi:hypothetical protein